MLNTSMEIQELIEQIAARSNEYGMFFFTLLDTNSPMYAVAVDCRGDIAARCDYFGTYSEKKFLSNADDAIAFLFDCDIHLWQLMSYDIQQVGSNCGLITTWNITLRRNAI